MEKLHLYKGISGFEYYCFTRFHDTTGVSFNNREIIKLNMWTHIFFNPTLKIKWSEEHYCPVVPVDKAIAYDAAKHKRYLQTWRIDYLTGEKYPLDEIDTVTRNGAPGRRYDWRTYHPGYFCDPYMWDVNYALLEAYPDEEEKVWANVPCVNAPLGIIFLDKLVQCLQEIRSACTQGFMDCSWWYERTYDCNDFGLNHNDYQDRLKKFLAKVWRRISGEPNLASLADYQGNEAQLKKLIDRRIECQLMLS